MGRKKEILQVLTKGTLYGPFHQTIEMGENIVWCKSEKACIVEYVPNTLDALRQLVFKGIRDNV